MAEWSSMRQCEEHLTAALSQSKKNSGDVAARIAAITARIEAGGGEDRRGLGGGGGAVGGKSRKGSMKTRLSPSRPSPSTTTISVVPTPLGPSGGGGVAIGSKEGDARRGRPTPIDCTRGAVDARVAKAARAIIAGLDLERYR